MTPAKAHMHVEVLFSMGMLPTRIFGDPGAHGAGSTGVQGMGVSTPRAAVVADATGEMRYLFLGAVEEDELRDALEELTAPA